jgi:molecular chaperone GrpE (heat shock protein)
MKRKNIAAAALVLSFGLGLAGCSTSQPQTQPPQPAQDNNQVAKPDQSNQGKTTPNKVEQAFQDEVKGLTSLEKAVNKNDFNSAAKIFDLLHDEFHASVLLPVKNKDAKLADDMHASFDSLEDAVNSKDKNKCLTLIKSNLDKFNQAAKVMGVSLK